MICGSCGVSGHNNRNAYCPAKFINLSDMYQFTHTGTFYDMSLKHILSTYPGRICLSSDTITWDENQKSFKNIEKILLSAQHCNLDYIYFKMSISSSSGNHANYILVHIKTNTFWRYEPHGSNDFNLPLDSYLLSFASKHNYLYVPPNSHCPYFGIQTTSMDDMGLCQTSVLFSLLSVLDPVRYNYNVSNSSSVSAKLALENLAKKLICNIYIKLSPELRDIFTSWNYISVFAQGTIHDALTRFLT